MANIITRWLGPDTTVPVVWFDRHWWDTCQLEESLLPDGAVPREENGEQVYYLERVPPNNGGIATYRNLATVEPSEGEISPADLYRDTNFPLVAKVYNPQQERHELLEKGLIIFTVVAGFIFLFLLVAIMIGD